MSDFSKPSGFMRLPEVLSVIPVSKSGWWDGIRDGRYPPAVKLGPRTTAWRVADIDELCALLSDGKNWSNHEVAA